MPGFFTPGHLGVIPAPVSHAPGPPGRGCRGLTSTACAWSLAYWKPGPWSPGDGPPGTRPRIGSAAPGPRSLGRWPLRLLPGPLPVAAAAWTVARGPVAVLPGARSLARRPGAGGRARCALVPGPRPRVETRRPIDRTPWPFFRFSRFWARVRSAEALARFRTENAALKSFRPIFQFLMFHVKHPCQKYPFRCRIDSV